jgi:putative ABC transport system ATP-binding protein
VTLVEFTDLARTYGEGSSAVVAVHGASGRVDPTDRIALVGRSGSGKSTLLALLAGLDRPTHGTITWPAFDGSPGGDPLLVGTVFQGTSLVPALTAVENVALPSILHGSPDAVARDSAVAAMGRLDIEGLADRMPDELSGGQAQRVAVARVLTMGPRLILADEPTGRLDHAAATRVADVLLSTADELGAGLVVATHDPQVAARLSSTWRIGDHGLVAAR